ncbi:translocation/assembly module TamB domain-containing protein [Tolypothrix sp. FACHB-123]|uniref:translocation/assembly module TamB domain-containing protein n=1 Tax=Tolypothrix sp. FACHB-123 TaxID=2692868 RepID=UPI0016839E39|nr:translocation/assembly module TamB domain-containing protein [Tolypothrix sp. FACHB-123]MBD2357105.1 translocation/assembly module TamB domain-containing protein [Tolypothrix sp. FACHB-123]
MTRSPDSHRRLWLLLLTRTSIGLVIVLIAGIVGGIWWANIFIRERLAPIIESNLLELLGRPVKLGAVQSFSPNSLRFGSTSVPATTTDPDTLVAQAVDVGFNPWELVFNRSLKLNVTLVRPDIYIEQDKQGRWVSTRINTATEERAGLITTELETLSLQNGVVMLSPSLQPGKPRVIVGFNQLNGIARFLEQNQRINFDISTQAMSGGSLQITGETLPKTVQTTLKIRTSNLLATNLSQLVQTPVSLQAGTINSDLTVNIPRNQLQTTVLGTVDVNQVVGQVNNLPTKITNTTGKLQFENQQVTLENFSANLGKIPVQINGGINAQTGYNLTANVKAVTTQNLLQTLNAKLPITSTGDWTANIKLQGAIRKPVITGAVSTIKPAVIDRVSFDQISTQFQGTPQEIVISQIQATPTQGGKITGKGRVSLGKQGRVAVNVQATNLPGDAIAQTYNVNLPNIRIGTVSANTQVSGTLANLQTLVQIQAPMATYPGKVELAINKGIVQIQNTALRVAGGTVAATGQLKGDRWQAVVDASQVPLQSLAQVTSNPDNPNATLPPQFQGTLNGEFNLAGTTKSFQIANIQAAGQANLNLAGGTVNVNNIRLNNGNWQAVANATKIQLNQFAENIPGQIINSNVQLAGNVQSFDLANIQASGEANLNVASGRVNLNNIRLNNGNWQALANASSIQLNQFAKNIPGQIVNSNLQISGNTNSFALANIQAAGEARLSLAQGSVNVRNIQLNNGNWGATATISQLQLNNLSQNLRGRLNGNVNVTGTTTSFQPQNIAAAGTVRLSQGLAALTQPLTAQFQWNGSNLQILQASAPGLKATGNIAVALQPNPQITGLNLNVQAQNYNLQTLPFQLPGNVALAGRVDFNGQVSGTPTTPIANGNIRLENLAVNNLAFDPVLTGNVRYQPGQGTQFQVTGTQDQISVSLGADNRPTAFNIRRDSTVATGRTIGDNLVVNVQDFPISLAKTFIPANNNLGTIGGKLSGNLTVNLNDYSLVGDIAVAQPQIGRITADEFRGNISYDNGNFNLSNGEIIQGENRYILSGNLPTTGNNPLQIALSFDQARIQNILQTLSIYNFTDALTGLQPPNLAGAEVLQTQPRSLPDTDLLTQIDYVTKIRQQVAQQRRQEQASRRIPSLAELQGIISGKLGVTGSLQSGLNIDFDFVGDNWVWGNYKINQLIASGNYENGNLTLQPLQVNLNNSLIAITGQFSQQSLSGQAQIQNLALADIKPFFPQLPVDIAGKINANATFSGSLNSPQAVGELALIDGSLNNQSIQSAQIAYNYNDARLNFGSNVLVTGTEPIQINGSIPAPLPFADTQPNDSISIQANVQNEGLALLNLLNNQVQWVDGQGQVNVQIQGTFKQPSTTGIATINNATLNVQSLTEPLTNVTGTAQFAGDRLIVDNLQAQYSRGQLTATGTLPIFATPNAQQQAASNPLTVAINNLQLNFQNLYQGGVSGNAVITGTALAPQLGGTIKLNNGEVLLGNATATTNTTTPTANSPEITLTTPQTDTNPDSATSSTPVNTPKISVEFANLQLILADDIRVTRQPLFSFVAQGDITLNGSLAKPRPQGQINLQGGQINLFTTQFTLARGYDQTAIFTPSRGLDPILDVRLVTIVPEVRGSIARTSRISSEIRDISAINFGTLNTVRIQAIAKGPASELSRNLVLTSEPSRNRGEIVALLGGSILNNLQQGDAGLGLINLASSAIFSNLQGTITEIGQTIGLSELRLFPTLVTNPTTNVSVLGLAAEGVFDISNNFSASLSRVFAANESLRYNVIYRLNDEIRVRASTNLGDEGRAVVEYETRF